MALQAGTRLGPYEISGPIGAGAMGEVYRARDTRLDRDVAVKVLPPRIAGDATALARFEREAKAVAAINHPGIMAIHDFGRDGETAYAVLELLEGGTLRDELQAGPPARRKAVDWGAQIAHGLAAAHDKGIWHRDLKPENVFVTRDGRVKILDFGLAKQGADADAAAAVPDSDTRTHLATEPGTVMGTVGYMSPEQVRAQPVDGRSDIFALGAILYEMFSGQRAFRGDSAVETMHAILHVDPPEISLTGEALVPAMERVLRRCLEKRPEQRFQSARDLAFALESLGNLTSDSLLPAPADTPQRTRARLGPTWLWLGLAVAAAFAIGWFLGPGGAPSVTTTWVDLHLERGLARIMVPGFDLAPDGRSLVYAAKDGEGLYIRELGSRVERPLEGTENARSPAFSPDGRWIAYDSGSGELRRIAASGGAPLRLCEIRAVTGISWDDGETLVFAPSFNTGLFRVSAEGGPPEPITTLDLDAQESSHNWPQVLPRGRGLLFTVETSGKTFDDATIVVDPLDGSPRRVIAEGGTYGRYLSTGHLLYLHGGVLFAAPFDLDALRLTGSPVEVVSGVLSTFGRGAAHYDVSPTGTLAFVPWSTEMRSSTRSRLLVVSPDGVEAPALENVAPYDEPRASPDGSRVVVSLTSSNDDVWVVDLARGIRSRLTFAHENNTAVWMPDGNRVVLSSDMDGRSNLYLFGADGSGLIERLTKSDHLHNAGSVSRDGTLLAYTERHPQTGNDIWLLPLTGDRAARVFRASPFGERAPQISPDGRWLVYVSGESGRSEIYVESLTGGARAQVTESGGVAPRWSNSGKALYYANRQGIFSVELSLPASPTSPPRIGRPTQRHDKPARYRDFDVLPDGSLVVVEQIEEPPFQRLQLALGWLDELRGRVDRVRQAAR